MVPTAAVVVQTILANQTGACSSSCDIRSAYVTHRPPPLGVICRWTSWWYRLQHPQPPRCTSLQQLLAVRGGFLSACSLLCCFVHPLELSVRPPLLRPLPAHAGLAHAVHQRAAARVAVRHRVAAGKALRRGCAEPRPGGRVAGPQGPLEGSRLRACWASPGAGRTAGGAALGRRARPLAGRAASLAGSVAGSAGAAGSSAASSAAGIAYRAWGGDPRGRRGRIDEG